MSLGGLTRFWYCAKSFGLWIIGIAKKFKENFMIPNILVGTTREAIEREMGWWGGEKELEQEERKCRGGGGEPNVWIL